MSASSMPPDPTANSPLPLEVDALVKRFGQVVAVDSISLQCAAANASACSARMAQAKARSSAPLRAALFQTPAKSQSLVPPPAPRGPSGPRLGAAGSGSLSPPQRHGEPALLRALLRPQRRKARQSVAWCLKWAALEDRAGDLTRNLSGGMKRRLNMAAGLIHQPRLVLMDEPTVGVDPQSRNRIFEMIAALRARGNDHHLHHALHGRSRAPVRPHRHRRPWPHHRPRHQGGADSQLLCLAQPGDCAPRGPRRKSREWVAARGGRLVDSTAEFTIERPTEVAGLLEGAAEAGLELVDLSLRRPNLESVFLHLTGRELRD
jgi:ABC-2 type transport system ATP-binding protein